ncbi:anthranilate phosphoribosyltransferase [Candidatus Micrarchaeota archaeon]|nr:anthranilate phosphoribosyltransferase [Candidatus Micrarchaeota archaeon]
MDELITALETRENLSENQSEQLADGFLDNTMKHEDIKRVLLALNAKGPCVEEVVGFAKSMRKHSIKIHPQRQVVDTCGTGGDGASTFNISTTAAFIVAACGQAVAKHGNKSVSSQSGSADVLDALGLNIHVPPEKTQDMIDETDFGFLFAPLYHPAMKHVAPVRKELGVKTIFNLLGPLTNPASAQFQVIGAYDAKTQALLAEAVKRLGTQRTLVVKGEKLDEAGFGKTQVLDVTKKGIDAFELHSEEFGLKGAVADLVVENAKQSALFVRQALQDDGVKSRVAALNAALALYAAGKAETVQEGFTKAKNVLNSGRAMFKLQEAVSVSKL